MSVIIRLQNLPWSANALDIRQFFSGLSIPEGGVHIVGGELGDAFIAFSTDEDARQAFNLNSRKIKEVQIKLMLSSRTEMQKVIEAARNPLAAFMQHPPTVAPLPSVIPAAVPAAIPEIKKEDGKEKERRGRRHSRSRSRERKDRSRDRDRRDRRRRDRSRSKSRDRRDRRRRERSHSRDRRSKDRERRSKDRKQNEDKISPFINPGINNQEKPKIGVWEDPLPNEPLPVLQQAQVLLSTLIPNNLEDARRNLNSLVPSPLILNNRSVFPNQKVGFIGNCGQDNWNANIQLRQNEGRQNFESRFNRNIHRNSNNDKFNTNAGRDAQNHQQFEEEHSGFNRNMNRTDGRLSRFDSSSDGSNLDRNIKRPTLLERSSRNEPIKNCCIQLQPFFGGYGEIRRFFQGIFIHNTGIKFVYDDHGNSTGVVYIRFATPDGKAEALERSGSRLKQHAVEITHIDDSVFENTIDRYRPDFCKNQEEQSPEHSRKGNRSPLREFSCLAVENLPLFTKEQDMLKIFSDYSLLSIWLVNKQRHVTAYIKFANLDGAKTALNEKVNQIFDGKPLDIRPCSDTEYSLASQDETETDAQSDKQDSFELCSDCVSLSGLPLKTTDRDISDFFSDVAIVPNKIHLINSNLGFTGQAFCEFLSLDDAQIALEKNGLPLGSGTVTVESVERSEMETILGISSQNSLRISNNHQTNRPYFQRNFGQGGYGPRNMGLMNHRLPMRRLIPPLVNPADLAIPGCTILMENVPYKAGLDEILEFFDGYDVSPDNVLRRYNENGTPSGEAKVIFNSGDDAFQAIEERHLAKIRDRTIYLSQC